MIFIDACLKKPTPYTPIWIMRQAGRYLPEYMEVRKEAGSFLNLCHNPELSAKVTIQPIDRLGVDAAILFSDILVLPDEMGMDLQFVQGEGPKILNSINNASDVASLRENASDKMTYVYETIKKVRENLDKEKALIGFAGSPWTIATYMVEGGGSKSYYKIKKMLYSDSDTLKKLLAFNTHSTKEYLENQIKAGVNAVMLFDSWASALEPAVYMEYSFSYMVEIASYLKEKYPHIPVILFPKGVSNNLVDIRDLRANFDVFGVDWGTPMSLAKEHLSSLYTLQGNIEPSRIHSKKALKECVESLSSVMKDTPHIFNLGHGIMPDAPIENVKYLVDLVHNITKR
jgi:uroporphyrinogen decarboxylase